MPWVLPNEIPYWFVSLESDGPFTSLPDDLMMVRKLLKDFEAGVDPQVVFHPDGWYEFKE